ncbi:MAG: hypothetical protein GEU90_11850 [Gemmatimonas sp.]|nr:hypothetical protein [Gemmatimonas sp.]
MIIEARRRELFVEGRYFATKIRTGPALVPPFLPQDAVPRIPFGGAVGLAMPTDEFDQKLNISIDQQPCAAAGAPIF